MNTSESSHGSADALRIEYVDGGTIDVRVPRFAWSLPSEHPGQHAYRLQVERNGEPLWDSGWCIDAGTVQHEYTGPALVPFGRYRWRVAIAADEPQDGDPEWSTWAEWDSGPMSKADWLPARWIGAEPARCETAPAPDERAIPDPYLRRRVEIQPGLRHATLYWSGLGGSIAHVDGRRISTTGLEPAPTRYDRTVLYGSADITAALSVPGDHVLGFELGRGKFAEPRTSVWEWQVAPWWDHPKLIALLRLEYVDGVETVVSDESWEWIDGPIRADSLLGGERFDARCRRDGWLVGAGAGTPVRILPAPGGLPRAQVMPPSRVVDELTPITASSPQPDVQVFDFGRQLAGWARVRLNGPAGAAVRIGYAEKLLPDGRIDDHQQHIVPPIQQDLVALDGSPLEYEPSFGYRGFRYVQVETRDGSTLETITARLAHTDVASRAEFSCGSPVLEQIRDASRRSILDNLHGIFTDTPMYEKNGWTADAMLSLETSMLEFDLGAFYTKWLQDFADSQRDDGEIPSIIPAGDWGYSDSPSRIRGPWPAWDAAYPEICWAMYRYLGDRRVLDAHLPQIVRYLDMLGSRWPDFLVNTRVGDWKPPDVDGPSPEGTTVYGTMFAYRILWLATAIARVIGDVGTVHRYASTMRRVRSTFIARFRTAPGDYRGDQPTGYRQSVNAVALRFGLVPGPERAVAIDNLLTDITARDGHLNTGAHGTKYLPLVLSSAGHAETAAEVLTATGYPSYARWFATGETNLWEGWKDSVRSRNHHYFSSPVQWMHEHLLGITPSSPGYRTIRIEPWLLPAIGHASGALETPAGRIAVSWERDDRTWRVGIDIPPGTNATIRPRLPGAAPLDIQHVSGGRHEFTNKS